LGFAVKHTPTDFKQIQQLTLVLGRIFPQVGGGGHA